ncbi:MAG: hypothetical protein AB8F95_17675 [Bacteroidia bacterium]
MKKHLAFLLFFSFFLSTCFAQFGSTKLKDFEGFKDKTTLFVKTESKELNKAIVHLMDSIWKLNEYKTISSQEIVAYTDNPDYLFLSYGTYNYSRGTPPMSYTVRVLNLTDDLHVSKKGIIEYRKATILAYAQENWNPALQFSTYQTDMLQAIRFIINHCELIISEKGPKGGSIKSYLGHLSSLRAQQILQKTLLIPSRVLKENVNTQIAIAAIYPFPFSFSYNEDIAESIDQADENSAYFFMFKDGNLVFRIVVECATGAILYGKVVSGTKQDKIGPATFKDIAKYE